MAASISSRPHARLAGGGQRIGGLKVTSADELGDRGVDRARLWPRRIVVNAGNSDSPGRSGERPVHLDRAFRTAAEIAGAQGPRRPGAGDPGDAAGHVADVAVVAVRNRRSRTRGATRRAVWPAS